MQSFSNLVDIDTEHIWHPFTQHQLSDKPLLVTRAKDEFIYVDDNGREKVIIDGVSSWWVNIHGHSNEYINEQLKAQLDRHQQVIFAGLTHEPATKLVAGLGKLLDPQLNKFFFSDDGSTSVEVAIKMAVQYFYNQGQTQRHRVIALQDSYHGDTVGAMSASGSPAFREAFSSMVFPVDFICSPADNPEQCLQELETLLASNPEKFAALIVEPLVQGAAGMRFYKPEVLSQMRKLCDQYSVLLITDEVFTGFGRTGSNFAYQQANIVPDIICLSKALTSGYLPMGLTVCRDEIYNAFLSDNKYKTFFHGHSYTANSLACTAALASLELYQKHNRLNDVARINKATQELKELESLTIVKEVRILGAIAVVELTDSQGYFSNIGEELAREFIKRGILLRPLGNVIYFLPPYIISDKSLSYCLATIKDVLKNGL